jgi:hypothetical protein
MPCSLFFFVNLEIIHAAAAKIKNLQKVMGPLNIPLQREKEEFKLK